jgi:very-short-patch-repair endonuclease
LNKSTPEEAVLWNHLRNRKFGVKFRRQFSIGPYITDFYCHELKLVIELDGIQHLVRKEYDMMRDSFLENSGYTVIRFSNAEIHDNLQKVIRTIEEKINNLG